ncbi:MAG: hypothetical protein A2Z97_02565 [Bdellovibrionales bacterium GWB1_52_6]|nr:MAG: hypothetical protein A2Z97_02565 [Bdellovibrionales bacterium GWB1_52_6]
MIKANAIHRRPDSNLATSNGSGEKTLKKALKNKKALKKNGTTRTQTGMRAPEGEEPPPEPIFLKPDESDESAAHRDIANHRQIAGAFDRSCKLALMIGAVARNSARNNLAMLSDKRLHHAIVFIVHDKILVRAETADFFTVKAAATTSIAIFVHTAFLITLATLATIFGITFQICNAHRSISLKI